MRLSSIRNFSLWLGLLAGGALSFAAVPVAAQAPSFEASAAVPVQEDLVRARGQALGDALGRALEQAVAQVAPEARSRTYLILGRTRDYVTTYRVLDEGEQAGEFQIRLEVQFDLPRLLRDLQAGQVQKSAAAGSVSLTVCTPSPAPSAQAALAAGRAVLAERAGATETLPADACAERLRSASSGGLPGAPGSLLVLVLDAGPQAAQTAEIRGTQPARFGAVAHAEWSMYRSAGPPLRETGEGMVFLDSADGALAEAQRLAALSALQQLIKRPGALHHGAPGVLLELEGINGYGDYQRLLKLLWALPGVSRVEPRRFFVQPASPGAASSEQRVQVLLHTAASAETVGAALGRAPLEGLRLQVAPVGPAELRVICTAASNLPSAPTSTDSSQPEPAELGGTQ